MKNKTKKVAKRKVQLIKLKMDRRKIEQDIRNSEGKLKYQSALNILYGCGT